MYEKQNESNYAFEMYMCLCVCASGRSSFFQRSHSQIVHKTRQFDALHGALPTGARDNKTHKKFEIKKKYAR